MKKRIIGLCMALIGFAYMVSLFIFTEAFDNMNDTLGMILTMISVSLIVVGLIFLFLKSPEDHFKEEATKKEEDINLSKYYKYKPYVTYVLVGINILAFIIINLIQGEESVLKFAISKDTFAFYRIITSMFTHADETHLLLNMLALLLCGGKLESLIGNLKYLIVYMISGLFSSLLIGLLSPLPCVGASGAIFGLLGCYLLLSYKNRHIMKYTYKYDLLPTVIFNLIVTIIIPNISITAHVGGLVSGIILYFILCRKITLK